MSGVADVVIFPDRRAPRAQSSLRDGIAYGVKQFLNISEHACTIHVRHGVFAWACMQDDATGLLLVGGFEAEAVD